MTIALGSKVRDMISGFSGIAVAHSVYLYGCERILIEPDRLDDKGAMIEGQWIDEQRVEVTEQSERPMSLVSSATSGGPQRDAPKGR